MVWDSHLLKNFPQFVVIHTVKIFGIVNKAVIFIFLHMVIYASKFGKLSSGHRTGKGQFSFQSQRKAMPKNVQITAELLSFHMLAK